MHSQLQIKYIINDINPRKQNKRITENRAIKLNLKYLSNFSIIFSILSNVSSLIVLNVSEILSIFCFDLSNSSLNSPLFSFFILSTI